MLRTALSVTAAAIAAMCGVAACGPVQMGAAAVVGSQRISAATLTAEVSNLEGTLHDSKGKVQPQFPQAQAPQEVLGWLLRFQVRERMAARDHVSVTTGDSQRALAAIASQASQSGSAKVPLAVLAAANGLPPNQLTELGRYQAIQDVIISQLDGGTLPSASAAVQALSAKFSHEQCVAAKSLNIQVNPQFGQMDYGTLSVIPATSPLSAPTVPAPAPSTKPRLTPPC